MNIISIIMLIIVQLLLIIIAFQVGVAWSIARVIRVTGRKILKELDLYAEIEK